MSNTTTTTNVAAKDLKKAQKAETLYKVFIYVVLALLAISIIVPLVWVFLASLKTQAEFSGNPWALPTEFVTKGFWFTNFKQAWVEAKMGSAILNSVIVTALGLLLLLVVALPAAYALSRMEFHGRKILNVCFTAGLFINMSYIAIPIFLELDAFNGWFEGLTKISGFFTNNLVMTAVIYASTALPFTIYLLSEIGRAHV